MSTRKERQKADADCRFLSVKTRLVSVCKSKALVAAIDDATVELSRAMTIATKLLLCYILERVENDRPVTITQTTIKHCIDVAGDDYIRDEGVDEDLVRVAETLWRPNLPPGYVHPRVNVLGNQGKQYLAAEFLTNVKNHVAVNFDHRHQQYVASIVGRWCDEVRATPTERRRAIRTVQCASLVKTLDEDALAKAVLVKFAQFEASDAACATHDRKRGK